VKGVEAQYRCHAFALLGNGCKGMPLTFRPKAQRLLAIMQFEWDLW
jgi:hypothetical protein